MDLFLILEKKNIFIGVSGVKLILNKNSPKKKSVYLFYYCFCEPMDVLRTYGFFFYFFFFCTFKIQRHAVT